MKRFLLCLALTAISATISYAQTPVMGLAEKKITDTLCDCVTRLDLSKIKTREEAIAAYTDCIARHADLFTDFAKERNEDVMNESTGEKLGMVIAKDLLAKNCQPFIKLSLLTVKKDDANANLSSVSAGRFKRIDNKGFNYIVLIDNNKQEKSFLWLRQFTGSENFTGDMTSYVGKEMKIGWQEIEVYLPQAKGYYKVKEITSISIL